MTMQLALVLILLAAAVAMFVSNRPRMDAVGLIMIAVLPFTGVLTINEALAGFADANIVLIAALFVIGEALVRTGVARGMGDWLGRTAGSSETRMLGKTQRSDRAPFAHGAGNGARLHDRPSRECT